VEIRELVWDARNRTKLRAHGIEQWEVDTMLEEDAWVPSRRDDYPDQVRIIGPTMTGRWLTVAVEPADDPAVWRPVTGWGATSAELAYYREEKATDQ
jgi:hypothetical protein